MSSVKVLFGGSNELMDPTQHPMLKPAECTPSGPDKTIEKEVIVVNDDVDHSSVPSPLWIQIDGIRLVSTDKEHLLDGKWLSDAHINSVQHLLKSHFPDIGGLESTLRQTQAACKPLPVGSL